VQRKFHYHKVVKNNRSSFNQPKFLKIYFLKGEKILKVSLKSAFIFPALFGITLTDKHCLFVKCTGNLLSSSIWPAWMVDGVLIDISVIIVVL